VEEPFEAGVCWGIARLAETGRIDPLRDQAVSKAAVYIRYAKAEDARLRAYAALAAVALRLPVPPELKTALEQDLTRAELYDFSTGAVIHTTVRELAAALPIG